MTQQEFNEMLAVAIAGGLGGGTYISRWDGEQIDDGIAKLQLPGGITTTELADGAVTWPKLAVDARPTHRNLLINAYFIGGGSQQDGGQFPINQRGVTGTISTPGYFIDGWKLISGSVTITAAGLVLNGTMVQILEQGLTSPFTASVLRSDGLFPAQYDNATKTFTITATGQTIIAAKLEESPYQTVAYQGANGNWVLNGPQPDFALELAKCQRYQLYGLLHGNFMGNNQYGGWILIPTPVTLRAKPTIVGTMIFKTIDGDTKFTPTRVDVANPSENGIQIVYYPNTPCYCWGNFGLDSNL